MSKIMIHEVQEREPLMETLVELWEASVRATHHFLSDDEVRQIKTYVPQALNGAAHLLIAENEAGEPIAFLGTENHRLEMLFLSPEVRGKGIGKEIMNDRFQPADGFEILFENNILGDIRVMGREK